MGTRRKEALNPRPQKISKNARILRCGRFCWYAFFRGKENAGRKPQASGKKNAVVIERGARAGFEALEQIVYLHMSALRPPDIQNDLAVIHHQRPIAESERGAHIMRYHQACQLLLGRDVRSHGQNFLCRTRIERCRVLVEQKELGLCYRRHQERQRLTLTAGQKPHRLPQAVFQPHIQLTQLFAEIFAVTAADLPQPAAAPGGFFSCFVSL